MAAPLRRIVDEVREPPAVGSKAPSPRRRRCEQCGEEARGPQAAIVCLVYAK